jgi:hydrogenase maturation protein HypF
MSQMSEGFIARQFHLSGNLHGSGLPAAVFRLVRSLNLRGWMRSYPRGYSMHLEGDAGTLRALERQIVSKIRPCFPPFELEVRSADASGGKSFKVIAPVEEHQQGKWVLPDASQCPNCVSEMLNARNRRFFYPFTFCADCGPKYSMARRGLMRRSDSLLETFPPCEQCQAESGNSRDRRFLHMLNTCPICGPNVELLNHTGKALSQHRDALVQAASALEGGRILAVKESTGYTLVALASSSESLRRLRALLGRPHHPLPLMMGSPDGIDAFAIMNHNERQWLESPKAPCLRLQRREGLSSLSGQVAPHGPTLDACLPASGVFHLLIHLLNLPIVVVSDILEHIPYACHEPDLMHSFDGGIDFILTCNLPVLRPISRTLVQQVGAQWQTLECGFGSVPLELHLPRPVESCLALGGRDTTALGFSAHDRAFLGASIGPVNADSNMDLLFDAMQDFKGCFGDTPKSLVADADPHLISRQYAVSSRLTVREIDHDLAHIMAGIGGEALPEHWMGVCFDHGLGMKEKIGGGGDVFRIKQGTWQRLAGLAPYWLPGGAQPHGDNRACLYGMLHEVFKDKMWEVLPVSLRTQINHLEIERWNKVFDSKIQCCQTRSATYWWHGLAALLVGATRNRYRGDAFGALRSILESETSEGKAQLAYSHPIIAAVDPKAMLTLDWRPMLRSIINDMMQGESPRTILQKVCETFVLWLVQLVDSFDPGCLVLSGSTFENKCFTDWILKRFNAQGVKVFISSHVPPHDAGLAVGQLLAVAHGMEQKTHTISSKALIPSRLEPSSETHSPKKG